MSIKVCLPQVNTPLVPGEVVMVKSKVGEVMHTLNSSGQLVPFSSSLLAEVSLRERAAIAAMQGFCANQAFNDASHKQIAEWSVAHADALIVALQKEVQP